MVEENCQLSTSATWSHVPMGGLVKKLTFCGRKNAAPEQDEGAGARPGPQPALLMGLSNFFCSFSACRAGCCSPKQALLLWHPPPGGAEPYLGVVGQHVVPQDGRPGVGHLADVGDHHHGQRVGLQRGDTATGLGRLTEPPPELRAPSQPAPPAQRHPAEGGTARGSLLVDLPPGLHLRES